MTERACLIANARAQMVPVGNRVVTYGPFVIALGRTIWRVIKLATFLKLMNLHAAVAAVTDRIRNRSQPLRLAYLARLDGGITLDNAVELLA